MLEEGIKGYKENEEENKEFLDNEPVNWFFCQIF
jgi:hypothetical protein